MIYQSLLRLYKAGKITSEQLDIAISKGWITEEQKAEIELN